MKKVFLSLLAVVVLSIMVSCGPSAEQIIGDWDLTKVVSVDWASYKMVYTFTADKFKVTTDGVVDTDEGTWALSGSKMTFSDCTGTGLVANEYDIKVENDVMTLTLDFLGIAIPQYEFKKK